MENNRYIGQPCSFSWVMENNNRPQQSQWLQTTLADVESKIKKILEVVEDEGDTFTERAEMYYQKRPQLITIIEDLQKSYHSLADKYHHLTVLRSESLGTSSSNSNKVLEEVHDKTEKKVVLSEREVEGEGKGWDKLVLEVSELIEENTSKQAELIKRYDKKKDDVKQLLKENRRLRALLATQTTKTTLTNSSTSKWKSTLFPKFSFS